MKNQSAENLNQIGKNISYLRQEIYKALKNGQQEIADQLDQDLFEQEYLFGELFDEL